jgi:hypothetical protein
MPQAGATENCTAGSNQSSVFSRQENYLGASQPALCNRWIVVGFGPFFNPGLVERAEAKVAIRRRSVLRLVPKAEDPRPNTDDRTPLLKIACDLKPKT